MEIREGRVLIVTGSSTGSDARRIMEALSAEHADRVTLIDAASTDATEIAAEAYGGTVGTIMICDDVTPEMRRAIMGIGTNAETLEHEGGPISLLTAPSLASVVGKSLAKSFHKPAPSRGDPFNNQAPRSYRGGRGRQRP